MRRWHSCVNASLGAWMIFSPWVLGFLTNRAASWSAGVLGVAICIFAVAADLLTPAYQVMTLVLGLCSVFSPWVVGFIGAPRAFLGAVLVGAAVAALSFWAISLATARSWMRRQLRLRSLPP